MKHRIAPNIAIVLRAIICLVFSLLGARFSIAADSTGTTASQIMVEARIDGPTELRVTKTGIYWICRSEKPGQHDGREDPTYVNGKEWQPIWGKPETRGGPDQSQEFSFPAHPGSVKFKFVIATSKRGGQTPETRDPIKTKMVGNEFSIFIPEGQNGACWYKFTISNGAPRANDPRPFPGSTPAATPAGTSLFGL